MGILDRAKATIATEEAKKAHDRGDKILTYKLVESSLSSKSTTAMPDISGQIQAIEDAGWTLTNMSTAAGPHIAVICLFRRR